MLDVIRNPDDWPRISDGDSRLLTKLVGDAVLSPAEAEQALVNAARLAVPIADVLLRQFHLNADVLAGYQATVLDLQMINPKDFPPDPILVDQIGALVCLRDGVLPWQRCDETTVILTCNMTKFHQQRTDLEKIFGKISAAIMTETSLAAAIEFLYSADLAQRAESCVPASQSCRVWDRSRAVYIAIIGLMLIMTATFLVPSGLIIAAMMWASGVLIVTTALKLAAAIASLRPPFAQPPPVTDADLPVITVLVPLYRETAIASHLLVRLAALRYPRPLLDVCLVLEQDDDTTRATLARTHLPGWMRAIVVPPGQVKTKPRALNYALPFARGTIVGVWDAEDAPAPDQLHIVARYFAQADPDVACLQGVLDFYNTRSNWLTRCFTIEYAAWFRVILPGLARMRLVVPLGGTTLFFRRDLLETLGAWDAHNVTEDADLGLRLARHGYRTALIPTVTLEEANGRAWPWVKQRSRWLKGYAITYGVHMRHPSVLLRDLGWRRFIGVQVLFAGTLSMFVMTPAFWSLWLIPLGFGHPLSTWLSAGQFQALWITFLITKIISLAINLVGLHKAKKRWLWGWALTLPIYFPLGALAVYRGLAELMTRPFYWDKTVHGTRQTAGAIPQPRPPQHPVSTV